jgi:hypothetical protein
MALVIGIFLSARCFVSSRTRLGASYPGATGTLVMSASSHPGK